MINLKCSDKKMMFKFIQFEYHFDDETDALTMIIMIELDPKTTIEWLNVFLWVILIHTFTWNNQFFANSIKQAFIIIPI